MGWLAAVAGLAACTTHPGDGGNPGGVTADNHTFFPITAGTTHALSATVTCESCHLPSSQSFTDVSCTGCHDHEQPTTDRLHLSVTGYAYGPATCVGCHPTGEPMAFDHAGITADCGACHDVQGVFNAFPATDHPDRGGSDCGACHNTVDWKQASVAPNDSHDPAHDLNLTALVPTYVATAIASVTSQNETLPMAMNHGSTEIPTGAMSACANCHATAATGNDFPGVFHNSLVALGLPQPTGCVDCHTASMPTGFVGPTATNPVRQPASPEMKHDAVAWVNAQATATALVTGDCQQCHQSPTDQVTATWATGKVSGKPVAFHLSLTSQPGSCLDCHANSRPTTPVSLATGTVFDHQDARALGDCENCHAGAATTATSWSGGKFHLASDPPPTSCLPCHAGERPTSTTGWQSTTWSNSPFDDGTNAKGISHGGGQDCVGCHTDTTQWPGGHFAHGPQTLAASQCVSCHTTQRPDLQAGTTAAAMATLLGFDHAVNGTGDCFGCHQSTVTAGNYVHYGNPSTGKLPGGDWQNGLSYPGSFVSSTDQFISLTEYDLTRSGPNNLITGISPLTTTLFNGMLHTSVAIPAAIAPGPTSNPDMSKCWHCHTNTNGTVTGYSNGQFHTALTTYAATPGGAVSALPQPTDHCTDCHVTMLPNGLVEKAANDLTAMNHNAAFKSPVTLGGATVSSVAQTDCSVCHKSPGVKFDDGVFHANIGAAVPQDCAGGCHYPVMADAAKADLTNGTLYAMLHRSTQLSFQSCDTCHAAAFGKATTTPLSATAWKSGAFHPSVSSQPTGCLDCHTVSEPANDASTQSTISYAMPQGGTTSNARQWMNHGSGTVVGKDCKVCHAADAKPSGSIWSPSDAFHAVVTNPATCKECHGLTNGGGNTAGTQNNLPAGAIDTASITTASSASGVSGSHDQIDHGDVNASANDCKLCHTQVGPSTAAGIQGKEWAQAKFHANFNGGTGLNINNTTGRCSNCHFNLKPVAGFMVDHTMLTQASGSTDCSQCHSLPGTGTTAAPNWLGASGGYAANLTLGGFTIPAPPAPTATIEPVVTNIPHPAVGTGVACTTCHATSAGGNNAFAYDHALAPTSSCNACHEAGSNLVTVTWNGATTTASGAGSTRPFTLVGLVPSFQGNHKALTNDYAHFYAAPCDECHTVPTGTVSASTGTTYTTRWKFKHTESKMKTPVNTCNWCHGSPNNLPN